MTCREIAAWGSAYVDRELPFPRRLSFRIHLLLCRKCRRFIEGIRSIVRCSELLRAPGPRAYDRLASRLTDPGPTPPDSGGD